MRNAKILAFDAVYEKYLSGCGHSELGEYVALCLKKYSEERAMRKEDGRMAVLLSNDNRKSVQINGVTYPSLNEAVRRTGLSITKVRSMANEFPNV